MADDLRSFIEDQPIKARRTTLHERALRWAKPRWIAIVAVLAFFLSATAVGTAFLAHLHSETLKDIARERDSVRALVKMTDELTIQAMGQLATARMINPKVDTDFYKKALTTYQNIAAQYETKPSFLDLAALAYRRIAFINMVLREWEHDPQSMAANPQADYRRSIDYFRKSLENSGGNPDLKIDLADTLLESTTLDFAKQRFAAAGASIGESIKILDSLTERLPQDWDSKRRGGYLVDLAFREIDLAILIERSLKGQFDARSQFEKGVANLCKALNEYPKDIASRPIAEEANQRIAGLQSVARSDWAIRLFESILTLAPNEPIALSSLAWLEGATPLNDKRNLPHARELAEKAIRIAPGQGEAWLTIGWVLLRSHQPEKAVQAFENSMKLRKEGDAFDWLGMALALSNDPESAAKWLEKAETWKSPFNQFDPELAPLIDEVRKKLASKPRP